MVVWLLFFALLLTIPPLMSGLLLAVAYLWVRWKRLSEELFGIELFRSSDHR